MDANPTISVRLDWIERRIAYWYKRRRTALTREERATANAHIDAYQLVRTEHGYPPISETDLFFNDRDAQGSSREPTPDMV